MKIVIAGAGDVGFHLANMLSKEQHDIIVIDKDKAVLEHANIHLDVLTMLGDATSFEIMRKANLHEADLMIAATASDRDNLLIAIFSKEFGAKQVIARVDNKEYLDRGEAGKFKVFGIDKVISPKFLAAKEIVDLIDQSSLVESFEFSQGILMMVGFAIDRRSKVLGQSFDEVNNNYPHFKFRPNCLLRGLDTIVPRRGDYRFQDKDLVYFVVPKGLIEELAEIIGKEKIIIKRVMILGGGITGQHTAEALEDKYDVTILERDSEKCRKLTEKLDNTLIINGDGTDIDLLREESLENMDAFLALTNNSETNIISSLLAKKMGVKKTVTLVENVEYIHLSHSIGVDTLINRKLLAANAIFRYVRKGRVEAITGLHGADAELIEFVIEKNNRLTKRPLKEIVFPKGAMIGGIIRGDKGYIPDGDFVMQVDDHVIVITRPECLNHVENIFK